MTLRALAAAALFALLALGSHAQLLGSLAWYARTSPGTDTVSLAEQRLAPLRDELPARGTVGYRCEPVPAPSPEADARYYLAQYVLCPVVVERRERAPLVVVDADSGARVEPCEAP
jgi:hypothetical protein